MDQTVTKQCIGCEETKLVSEYGKTATGKPVGRCKKCILAYQQKRTAEGRKTRVITEENRDFFRLGAMQKDDQIRDLQKSLAIMQTTINALVDVIKEADLRDLKQVG